MKSNCCNAETITSLRHHICTNCNEVCSIIDADEEIAMGNCVSPYTTDSCPYCVDVCKASHFKQSLNELTKNLKDE